MPTPQDHGKRVYFVLDVEITGSQRILDCIIELALVAVGEAAGNLLLGTILGAFNERINNCGKNITKKAYETHGISEQDLRGLPAFKTVGKKMIAWMQSQLGASDVGILVCHNGSLNFQFLGVELARSSLLLPNQVQHCLCTLDCTRRCSSYAGADRSKWPEFTEKGNLSLKIKTIVNLLLEHGPSRIMLQGSIQGHQVSWGAGEQCFETVCGRHHAALADAIGCAIILFDKNGFMAKKDTDPLCKPFAPILEKMEKKMKNPIEHEEVHEPWYEYKNSEIGDCEEQSEITHDPPENQPPGPSAFLKKHINFQENQNSQDIVSLMTNIFFFFFHLPMLQLVVDATNDYATVPTVQIGNYKGPPRTDAEQAQARNHCKKWKPMCLGELIAFIGVIIIMGSCPRKRNAHYWMNIPGSSGPHPTISRAMKKD